MRHSETRWLLFLSRFNWRRQIKIEFVSEAKRHQATFTERGGRGLDVSCTGEVSGGAFLWEAEARKNLDDNGWESAVPMFTGKFSHAEGASGDFTIRQQSNGDWMTIGVYGCSPTIRLKPADPRRLPCALDVIGIPGMEVRLESAVIPWSPPTPSHEVIKRAGALKHYAGYCLAEDSPATSLPPALATVVAMLIADELVLSRYFNKGPEAS
jgi:hypothetical protein